MFKKMCMALVLLFSNNSAMADLAIIGHPEYFTGELDAQSVKKLFLGERKSFPDGLHATPINHTPGSNDRKEFFESVLRMQESSHERHWTRKRSTGVGYSPIELNSHDAVLRSIANTPSAISYIDSDLVNDSVKVLLIINDIDDV
jgi:ABC-type phosphate transport system substrate-binding protein